MEVTLGFSTSEARDEKIRELKASGVHHVNKFSTSIGGKSTYYVSVADERWIRANQSVVSK